MNIMRLLLIVISIFSLISAQQKPVTTAHEKTD